MSSHFDKSAADWDKGDLKQVLAQKSADAIIKNVTLTKTMKIMDFGAGTGLLSFKIAPLVAEVTGVDTSAKMLEQLEAKNSAKLRVHTCLGDITQMPLDETFDGIISAMAMHHVEDTAAFLKTLYAHLNEGGFIAIADLEKEDGRFHPQGIEGVFHHGFEHETLQKLAEAAGFSAVTFHPVHTVKKENGDYPLFLMCATK